MNKRIPTCCNRTASYNEKWDAYYCGACVKWLEPKCSDPDCDYCDKRPSKPVLNIKQLD